MAGAAGVGGSTVEAYNETMRLSDAMAKEQQDRATNSALIGQTAQIGETLEGAVAGMDNNIYRASLDYTQYVDPVKQSTFAKIATLGVAAAATVFGGPQAGMAVINFSEAQAEANKGNFDAAGANMMASIGSAASAAKSYQQTGGHYWGAAKAKTPSFGSTNMK
jgi:predicted RNA polymerase sigma factor